MSFIVICISIFLSGFLYTYLIPLVPSYHLITGAYFSTAEVALLFASWSFGAGRCLHERSHCCRWKWQR